MIRLTNQTERQSNQKGFNKNITRFSKDVACSKIV